jgi:5-methylcytosine-specific restriction endonuclease McrA
MAATETRTCQRCGEPFVPVTRYRTVAGYKGIYCSRRCANAAMAQARLMPRTTCICAICGAAFSLRTTLLIPSQRIGTYCSVTCRSVGRRHTATRQCELCGASFTRRASPSRPRRFCSHSCAITHARLHPESSPLYIDGSQYRVYTAGFTAALKQRIRQRDGGVCQLCGRLAGRSWTIHHIDGRKDDHAAGNLVLLCRSCHSVAHRAPNRAQLHWRLIVQMAARIGGYLPAPAPAILN